MFGFLVGTICLIALIMVLRSEHRRNNVFWGSKSGFNSERWSRRHGRKGQIGRNPFLRHLFGELDTTPGQEKEIRGALDTFFSSVGEAKQSMWDTRGQLARVFRSDSFDETAVGVVIEQHDEIVDKVRRSAVDALAEIYRVLDPQQRERVARWLDNGPKAPPAGPYRTAEEA
jgi:Spy/CpxP family protein refolding chaperone